MTNKHLLKGIQDWIEAYKFESKNEADGTITKASVRFPNGDEYNWNGKEFQKVSEEE